MKKSTFLTAAIFSLFIQTKAQTFTLINIDTLTVDATGSVPSCHANIQNNGSTGFYVDVLRVLNDTAPNWQTAFCIDVCYPPQVDSARFYLPASGVQGFLLEFFADTLPDTTIVFMKFKNVSDPSNTFSQHYYGITDLTFGIKENADNVSVNIFPMPALQAGKFTFRISNMFSSSEDYSLLIYDIYGNKVDHIDGLTNGENYLSLDLSGGIYLYRLTQGSKHLKSGKIVLSR